MSDEQNKPQPVDNSHLDAGIAARSVKEEADKLVEKESAAPKAESQIAEQNHPEGSAASEADDAAAQNAKNKGVGKRIDELTREKHDARRERDYWREQAMRGSQKPEAAQQPPQQATASDEPTLEAHGFDVAAYNRAWYDWKRGEERKVEDQQKQAKALQEKARKYQESAQAFAEAHPDFHDVVGNPDLPVTQEMADAIADSDTPAAVAYYLGTNPQEAERIAGLSPAGVARAIGRIEAQLEAKPPAAAEPPRQITQKTVTQAPPPVTTLSGAPAVVKDLDDMSMAEYDAERRKQRRSRGN